MPEVAAILEDLDIHPGPAVKKLILAAEENGWQLNPPGVTCCFRLNHPSDELAQPVYVTYALGRSPTGKLSWRFMSAATAGLVPLKGQDLLAYLADPTIAYALPDDPEPSRETPEEQVPWNRQASPVANLSAQLGASVVEIRPTTAAEIVAAVRPAPGPNGEIKGPHGAGAAPSTRPDGNTGQAMPQPAAPRRSQALRVGF